MRRTASCLALIVCTVASTVQDAQDQPEKINRDVYFRIRSEAAERFQTDQMPALPTATTTPQ